MAPTTSNALHLPIDANDPRSRALVQCLEGRRRWLASGGLSLEPTPANLAAVARLYPALVPAAGLKRGRQAGQGKAWGAATLPAKGNSGHKPTTFKPRGDPLPATKPYKHQAAALAKASGHKAFALFMEQGTGKSWVAIQRAAQLWSHNEIDAVLVISKKGVHAQWLEEQVPLHLGKGVPRLLDVWRKKMPRRAIKHNGSESLHWFAINVDALVRQEGYDACVNFIVSHGHRVLIIIDESQTIKNASAKRTKAAYKLGNLVQYRMILTGTPIAKDLTDEWAQFKFVDERILEYRYVTAFRAYYCLMGGFENRQVIGTRNLDEFLERVGPYNFRVTKEEELDLPPKNFATVEFEMADDQRRHYNTLKESFLAMLDNKELLTVANAAVLVTRLQQITSGLLASSESDEVQYLSNPRLDALLELLEQRPGKTVIWARFNHDIEQIQKALGDRCVTYYGKNTATERDKAKQAWLDPKSGVDYFVSNPAAGGTGLNLQGDCRTVVYYTNSYNAIDRWQSEDRTHRIGTKASITYFDLVCRGSTDRKVLANLKSKKSLSDLALGDIAKLIKEAE